MDERHAAIRNLPSLTPATPADLAAALREASAAGRPVVPLGAGAHQHLGAPPPAGALHIGTVALNQVLEYAPADLTATAQAGVTLAALQQELARHGQWLPWDPPGGERATLGGLLAAALSGPLRLGYGAPRDWVLGMRVALGDGRIVKSGGRVVKNVAGYDAHKLHIGALGTLGVILDVTFKLAPLPERMATLAWACPDLQAALTLARALRERPLAPVSLALLARPAAPTTSDQRPAGEAAHASSAVGPSSSVLGPSSVVARFAGVPAAVDRQLREARARAAEHDIIALDLPEDGGAAWREVAGFPAPMPGALILRAGVRPSSLAGLAAAIEAHAPPGASAVLSPGVGLAYACWPAEPPGADEISARLAALRARLAPLGAYAVVEHAPGAMRAQLDLWGPPPETIDIMRRLKAAWDPRGILNPGRYIAGL